MGRVVRVLVAVPAEEVTSEDKLVVANDWDAAGMLENMPATAQVFSVSDMGEDMISISSAAGTGFLPRHALVCVLRRVQL